MMRIFLLRPRDVNVVSRASGEAGGRWPRRMRRAAHAVGSTTPARSTRGRWRSAGRAGASLVFAGAMLTAAAGPASSAACSGYGTAFAVNATPSVKGTPDTLWSKTTEGFSSGLGASVAPGTQPATAASGGCGAQFAWHGTNGGLWKTSPTGPVNIGIAMADGTSPSMVHPPAGGYWIAFNGGDGDLWLAYNTSGNGAPEGVIDTNIRVAAGTSPAAAAMGTTSAGFAWQGTNNDLWRTSAHGPLDTGVKMMPDTSPSAATRTDGTIDIAVQGSDGHLWTETISPSDQAFSFDWRVLAPVDMATSPSVATDSSGDTDIAYITQAGDVEVMTNGIPCDVSKIVGVHALGTSGPAIAAGTSGFVVAFEDANATEREVTGAVLLGAPSPDTISAPGPAIVSAPAITPLG
jgi:hypothetical protein